jgi:hypothetical protein
VQGLEGMPHRRRDQLSGLSFNVGARVRNEGSADSLDNPGPVEGRGPHEGDARASTPPPLPEWVSATDPQTNQTYYVHLVDGEVRWPSALS